MKHSRRFRLCCHALGALLLISLWAEAGLARQSRFTANAWHGVALWCEQVGVFRGNVEVARLRLGEVYVWHDLPRSEIGSRCVAPVEFPKSGPGTATLCQASSVAIASFEIEVLQDGSKTRLLRVICVE